MTGKEQVEKIKMEDQTDTKKFIPNRTTPLNKVLSGKLKVGASVTLKLCDQKEPVSKPSHYRLCILHIGRNSRPPMQIKTQAA